MTAMATLLHALLLCATALASPIQERAAGPSVTIKNGTVIGSTENNVDSFKGIPYAQPPTGTRRLRPPQTIASSYGTITATAKPSACPQFLFQQADTSNLSSDARNLLRSIPFYNEIVGESEDCLTINVQRPAGTTSSSKLPVVFWIFGGGFAAGATNQYDGTSLVKRSAGLGASVIYVSVNYRTGGFGFLAGKELAKEGSTNLGLRDQRLGLQWVAENIAAFGGDPSKVTLWGESAGAISVYDHTIINGGDHTYNGKPLFRGGIMNSGSLLPADTATSAKAQGIYDLVVKSAKCDTASNTLDCLRKLDYYAFLDATKTVPAITGYRALDISYLPRPDPGNKFFSESPENALKTGKYAKVPVINGNQEDEGTFGALVQVNISNNAQVTDYLTGIFVGNPNARRDVTAYLSNYPDKPEGGYWGQPDGSPFRTNGNNFYAQFKRLAAVVGDQFILLRRVHQNTISKTVNTWAYQSSFYHDLPILGTFHGTDIIFSYAIFGEWQGLTKTFQTYYISFINHLDPNVIGNGGTNINWPKWDATNRQLLNLEAGEKTTLIKDDFREGAYQYQLANSSQFRL